MCLDIFPQVDLNAATEINWNLPGEGPVVYSFFFNSSAVF